MADISSKENDANEPSANGPPPSPISDDTQAPSSVVLTVDFDIPEAPDSGPPTLQEMIEADLVALPDNLQQSIITSGIIEDFIKSGRGDSQENDPSSKTLVPTADDFQSSDHLNLYNALNEAVTDKDLEGFHSILDSFNETRNTDEKIEFGPELLALHPAGRPEANLFHYNVGSAQNPAEFVRNFREGMEAAVDAREAARRAAEEEARNNPPPPPEPEPPPFTAADFPSPQHFALYHALQGAIITDNYDAFTRELEAFNDGRSPANQIQVGSKALFNLFPQGRPQDNLLETAVYKGNAAFINLFDDDSIFALGPDFLTSGYAPPGAISTLRVKDILIGREPGEPHKPLKHGKPSQPEIISEDDFANLQKILPDMYQKYDSPSQEYEIRLSEYEDRLSEYEDRLSEYPDKLSEYEIRLSEYKNELSEYEDRLLEYEARRTAVLDARGIATKVENIKTLAAEPADTRNANAIAEQLYQSIIAAPNILYEYVAGDIQADQRPMIQAIPTSLLMPSPVFLENTGIKEVDRLAAGKLASEGYYQAESHKEREEIRLNVYEDMRGDERSPRSKPYLTKSQLELSSYLKDGARARRLIGWLCHPDQESILRRILDLGVKEGTIDPEAFARGFENCVSYIGDYRTNLPSLPGNAQRIRTVWVGTTADAPSPEPDPAPNEGNGTTTATISNILDAISEWRNPASWPVIINFYRQNQEALERGDAVTFQDENDEEKSLTRDRMFDRLDNLNTFYAAYDNNVAKIIQSLAKPEDLAVFRKIFFDVLQLNVEEAYYLASKNLYSPTDLNSNLRKFLDNRDIPMEFRAGVLEQFRDRFDETFPENGRDFMSGEREAFREGFKNYKLRDATDPDVDHNPSPPPRAPSPPVTPPAPPLNADEFEDFFGMDTKTFGIIITQGTNSDEFKALPGDTSICRQYPDARQQFVDEADAKRHIWILKNPQFHQSMGFQGVPQIESVRLHNGPNNHSLNLHDSIQDAVQAPNGVTFRLKRGTAEDQVTLTPDKLTAQHGTDDGVALLVTSARAAGWDSYHIDTKGDPKKLLKTARAFAVNGLDLDANTQTRVMAAMNAVKPVNAPELTDWNLAKKMLMKTVPGSKASKPEPAIVLTQGPVLTV